MCLSCSFHQCGAPGMPSWASPPSENSLATGSTTMALNVRLSIVSAPPPATSPPPFLIGSTFSLRRRLSSSSPPVSAAAPSPLLWASAALNQHLASASRGADATTSASSASTPGIAAAGGHGADRRALQAGPLTPRHQRTPQRITLPLCHRRQHRVGVPVPGVCEAARGWATPQGDARRARAGGAPSSASATGCRRAAVRKIAAGRGAAVSATHVGRSHPQPLLEEDWQRHLHPPSSSRRPMGGTDPRLCARVRGGGASAVTLRDGSKRLSAPSCGRVRVQPPDVQWR